jgi:hypothetical protein
LPSVRYLGALIACFGMAWASATNAQVVGDGGLLTVGGSTYRLWGLVVPSETTACAGTWKAGAIANRTSAAWSRSSWSTASTVATTTTA